MHLQGKFCSVLFWDQIMAELFPCSNPVSVFWDILFLILSYWQSQMYAPSVLNRWVEVPGGNDAFHLEHIPHMMPSVACGSYCENHVVKWFELKMTATNVASVERQDKQLTIDKGVRLTMCLKYC